MFLAGVPAGFRFDPNDRSNFDLVKGFSVLRYFNRTVDNELRTARLDFDWSINDQLTLNFGGTNRIFEFTNSEGRRSSAIEAINPTLQEAGLTIDVRLEYLAHDQAQR